MLNINIGGFKGFKKFPDEIKQSWKVLDIDPRSDYVCDLNSGKPLPLENDSVDNYYASMILEHVKPSLMNFIFNEIHRTLKPGGAIRIVVPDIYKGIKAYTIGDIEFLSSSKQPTPDECFPSTLLGKLMGWFYTAEVEKKGALRSGHCMVFDRETLALYLNACGFKKIRTVSYKVCSEIFKDKDFERYKDFGLYMEATK